IKFMESIHAQSYSTIFTTLNNTSKVESIFKWGSDNKHLQKKIRLILDVYKTEDPIKVKVASVFLESFLFYSGFYPALRLVNEFPNIAEIIKLIIRDESMHGTYIGYKFKKLYSKLDEEDQNEIKQWVYTFLFELYETESKYTEDVYDDIGWTEDVKKFVEYNANKALSNLGLDQVFATTADDVNPLVIQGLNTGSINHDFFSQVGNSYIVGKVESTREEDYEIISHPIKQDYNFVEKKEVVNKRRYI